MAMGKCKRERQPSMWVATRIFPRPRVIYFRLLLIGYFEGIDSERGIAWRAADSFALRDFLGVGLEDAPPDHSTISRTRRLIDLETHRAVFTWVLQCVGTAGLVKGKTIGIDATTLEANAALRSIVRRDTGESYEAFLQGADESDTTTIQQTLPEAAEQLQAAAAVTDDAVTVIEEVVADKAITVERRCTIWRRLRFVAKPCGRENVLKRLLVHAG